MAAFPGLTDSVTAIPAREAASSSAGDHLVALCILLRAGSGIEEYVNKRQQVAERRILENQFLSGYAA